MCSPMMAVAAAGAGLQAIGAYQQAQAQRGALEAQAKQREYAAQVSQQNENIERQRAAEAARRGVEEESVFRTKKGFEAGALKSDIGASGVLLESGSPLQAILDTAYITGADSATIRQNAAKDVYGYRVAGHNFRNEKIGHKYGAKISRFEKSSISPGFAAATTLISGLGRIGARSGFFG